MDSILEILLNLKNPPSASQPQPSLRSVEVKTPTKQHSLMQSRQSIHSGPAQDQYEEANFHHGTHNQETTHSEMPNETTTPVVPFYRRRSCPMLQSPMASRQSIHSRQEGNFTSIKVVTLNPQENKDRTNFPSSKLNMPSPSKLQSPMASRQSIHSRQEGNFTSIKVVTLNPQENKDRTSFPSSKLNMSSPSKLQSPMASRPLTPLRAITTEEGGQISIFDNNNTNKLNHHLDIIIIRRSAAKKCRNGALQRSTALEWTRGLGRSRVPETHMGSR
jgi:hypothetical protein